jgi:hypothetical protein
MKTQIIMTDPSIYKQDMENFMEIFPEMIDYFNKKENYFVYNNMLVLDINIEQFDAISDIYCCQFINSSFIISNTEF